MSKKQPGVLITSMLRLVPARVIVCVSATLTADEAFSTSSPEGSQVTTVADLGRPPRSAMMSTQ